MMLKLIQIINLALSCLLWSFLWLVTIKNNNDIYYWIWLNHTECMLSLWSDVDHSDAHVACCLLIDQLFLICIYEVYHDSIVINFRCCLKILQWEMFWNNSSTLIKTSDLFIIYWWVVFVTSRLSPLGIITKVCRVISLRNYHQSMQSNLP